jgi:ribonuclease P protein component
MKNRLRGSSDFQKVYKNGKRIEGSLLTAFVLPNRFTYHRLGVTASKKAVGTAVDRNRAKRLLRETFRLTKPALESLQGKYDWVLNGRRRLLASTVKSSMTEFERVVGAVAKAETVSE